MERLPLAPPRITDPYRKEARALARLAEAHAHLCRHDWQHARERLEGVPSHQRSPLGALVLALYELQRSPFKTAPYQCIADALRFTKDQPLLWIYRAVARLAVQADLTKPSLQDVAQAIECLRTRPHPHALNLARGLRADLLSQRPTVWTEKARRAVQELEGGEDKHPWLLARLEDDPDLYQRAYQLHQAEPHQATVIAAEHALCLLRKTTSADTLTTLARAVAADLADKIPQQLSRAFQLLDHPQLHTLAVGTRLLTMARSHYYRASLYRLPAGPVRVAG